MVGHLPARRVETCEKDCLLVMVCALGKDGGRLGGRKEVSWQPTTAACTAYLPGSERGVHVHYYLGGEKALCACQSGLLPATV